MPQVPLGVAAGAGVLSTAPVTAGAAATVAAGAATTTAATTLSATLTQVAISSAVSTGLGVLAKSLQPGIDQVASATFSKNGPAEAWVLRFGEFWTEGNILYHTSLNEDEILNILEAYCPHEIKEFVAWQLNDQYIYNRIGTTPNSGDFIDSNGYVIDGKYYTPGPVAAPTNGDISNCRIEYEDGSGTFTTWPPFFAGPYGTYEADNELALLPDEWTNVVAHGSGAAKCWFRFKQQPFLFPNGVSNRKTYARWNNQIYDTRDASTGYSSNPSLILRYYLTLAKTSGGAGISTSLINDDSFDTAANICDEEVELSGDAAFTLDVGEAYPTTDEISLSKGDSQRIWLQTGDGIEFTNGGTLPSGLSASPTRYYAIVTQLQDGFEDASDSDWRIKVATTYANALEGTAVDLTTAGSGGHTVQLKSVPRYIFAGSLDTSSRIRENIQLLLNAMGGTLTPINGKMHLQAAAWVAPTLSFNNSHLRAPLEVIQTKDPADQRFNAVMGEYINPSFYGVPQTYGPVTNSTYETEDGGNRKYKEQNFPGVPRRNQAERLAKIILEKQRQEIIIKLKMKLGDKSGGDPAFKIQKGDNIQFTNSIMGWTDKAFEVLEWELEMGVGEATGAAVGVNIVARETASTVYDFNSGDETTEDPAPDTELPSTFDKTPPSGLNMSESRVDYADGTIIRVKLEWTEPTTGYVDHYESQYKLSSESTYIDIPDTKDDGTSTTFCSHIYDLEVGEYDFRVRAVDSIGKKSDYISITRDVVGFNANPGAPQGWNGTPIGDTVLLAWDEPTEDDVRYGGSIIIRHDSDPVSTSSDWNDSVSIGSDHGEYVAGFSRGVTVGLREGHYVAKFKDRYGQLSDDFATLFINQNTSGYTSEATVTEHSTFSGTKTDCNVSGGALTIDTVGGVSVNPTATYEFASTMDFGSAKVVRVTPNIDVNVFLEYSNFDSRTDNIDTWLSFDDADGGEADARVYFRTTKDDPTGTPTWSTWSLLDVAVVLAWGIEFKLEMISTNSQANIDILELSAEAELIP